MIQRDWQEGADMIEAYLENRNLANYPEQNLRGIPVVNILFYWLQEAKELQEIVSGRGRELLRHRDLLKGLNDELTATEARADAAVAREQQLKEVVQLAINDLGIWGDKITAANVVLGQLQRTLSTLYPDTPAPTEEPENKCPGCGSHMVPQWGGDEGPDSHWEECQNPDCDYEEGDNQ
ncbi:hypothetical protein MHI32_11940 [Paenibacillus sp. FSL H7-0690]|uniref:hypothetical protein n=1 Tax=Paenibacillus sp. FSL H7-0690 TaxID=2921437 RepID=UPI0030EEC038